MQTFAPYGDPHAVARVLDRQRLGKQRVETLQILNTLVGNTKGWSNHPAVRMWRGYECALVRYGLAMCLAWTRKGYADTCKGKMLERVKHIGGELEVMTQPYPDWLDDARVHESHRSNLIRKDPNHYGKVWPLITPNLPYYWPVT